MLFDLTEGDKKIIADARSWAQQELAPRAGTFDREQALPPSIIEEMGRRRYLGATFPEEYGGFNLSPVAYGLLTEELGKGCPSTRALLTLQTSLVGESILRCGSDEQKAQWIRPLASGEFLSAFGLTEPNVGSDARHIQTRYENCSNGFRLRGQKKWTSFGGIAKLFIIIANNGDESTAFLVERDRPGFSVKPMRDLMGMRACHVAELTLDGVEVPTTNVLGGLGQGFRYVVNTALDHGRYSVAWGALAIAAAALDAMTVYARSRKQFGQPLGEFQLIRRHIADAVTQTTAARALCLEAGVMRQRADPDAIMRTTMAKYFASIVAMSVTTSAVQVHGGNGCSSEYPVERLMREAKVTEIIEGTSEMQQEMIGKFGLQRFGR
jgi:hypothetical protein